MRNVSVLNTLPRLFMAGLLVASLGVFQACQDPQVGVAPNAPTGIRHSGARTNFSFYLLADGNKLIRQTLDNSASAGMVTAITGLQDTERMVAIDFRPATGQLYGVTDASRLYVIRPETGAARMVGNGPFAPPVNTNEIDIDFNPTVDRIRLVSTRGQNLRLNPETGTVAATDGSINGVANAAITAVAYTNNRAGAATTTLYDIDAVSDKLYRQMPPNDGTLAMVGSLGVDVAGVAGFDISPDNSIALATLYYNGKQNLAEINLATGQVQTIGGLPDMNIIDLAIPTEPVAYALTFDAAGANTLAIFNPFNPAPVLKTITGLASGELLEGVDFRPANGQLYALGRSSRLYTINTSSGAAAMVGSGPFGVALTGEGYGFDFNPVVDRIRVVSSSGQNLRLNPETGAVAAIDAALGENDASRRLTGGAVAAAYTNNYAGATSTTLYVLGKLFGSKDGSFPIPDVLYAQSPPNDGTLVERGRLNLSINTNTGFDIGGTSNMGYAVLSANGGTRVYRIDLTSGSSEAMATVPFAVRGFALGLGF